MAVTEVVVGAVVGAAVGWPGIWYQARAARKNEARNHREQRAAEGRALAAQREADIRTREHEAATPVLVAAEMCAKLCGVVPTGCDPTSRSGCSSL